MVGQFVGKVDLRSVSGVFRIEFPELVSEVKHTIEVAVHVSCGKTQVRPYLKAVS